MAFSTFLDREAYRNANDSRIPIVEILGLSEDKNVDPRKDIIIFGRIRGVSSYRNSKDFRDKFPESTNGLDPGAWASIGTSLRLPKNCTPDQRA
jgi:hypothetical protein